MDEKKVVWDQQKLDGMKKKVWDEQTGRKEKKETSSACHRDDDDHDDNDDNDDKTDEHLFRLLFIFGRRQELQSSSLSFYLQNVHS